MTLVKNKWFVISSGTAPIYSDANFNSRCLSEAVRGESCEILDVEKNWLYIKCEDNYKGWINKFYGFQSQEKNEFQYIIAFPNEFGFFSPKYPFGAKINHDFSGSIKNGKNFKYKHILKLLKNLLGIPYRWGGKTSLGFDCSGLVQSVLKVHGLKVPRDSNEQWKFFELYKIQLSESKVGDLHFFGKGGKIAHVGFSIGGHGIIHSQGYVKQQSLDEKSPYFNKNLLDIYLCSASVSRKFNI